MSVLQKFFGVGAAVALLGTSVAMAEIKTGFKPLEFEVRTADGSVTLPDFSFDKNNGGGAEESQATCAMTPGGPSPGVMMELPIIPPVVPDRIEPVQDVTFSAGTLPSQRRFNEQSFRDYENPTPPPEEKEIPVVPEPATLVVIGLGVTGVAVACRRWRKSE